MMRNWARDEENCECEWICSFLFLFAFNFSNISLAAVFIVFTFLINEIVFFSSFSSSTTFRLSFHSKLRELHCTEWDQLRERGENTLKQIACICAYSDSWEGTKIAPADYRAKEIETLAFAIVLSSSPEKQSTKTWGKNCSTKLKTIKQLSLLLKFCDSEWLSFSFCFSSILLTTIQQHISTHFSSLQLANKFQMKQNKQDQDFLLV